MNYAKCWKYVAISHIKNTSQAIKKPDQRPTTSIASGINDTTPIKDGLHATKRQLETITGIWEQIARNKSPMALREFIFRIVKIRPLHLKSLSREDARDVVQALIQMKEKHANSDNK